MKEVKVQFSIRLTKDDHAWATAQAGKGLRSLNGYIQYLIKKERKLKEHENDKN